jgi:hypothetical protein
VDEIRRRRREAGDDRDLPEDAAERGPSASLNLIGLSFSGGGIRAASLSLGVAQCLIEKGLWKYIDYLSTVSGGGYTGSCLSALMAGRHDGEKLLVHREGMGGPAALNHLRNNSNFLLPGGLFNRLRMPSLFMIAILQTLLLLLPVVIFFVFLTELFFEVAGRLSLPVPRYTLVLLGVAPLISAIFLRPILQSRRRTWERRDRADRRAGVCVVIAIVSLLALPVLAGLKFLIDSDLALVAETIRDWLAAHVQLGVTSWLLWLAVVFLAMIVVGLVRFRTTLLLWGFGLAGPLVLFGFYLLCCVYVINSPDVNLEIGGRYTAALTEYQQDSDQAPLQQSVDEILSHKHFNPAYYRVDFDTVNRSDIGKTRLKVYRRHDAPAPWWYRYRALRYMTTRHQDELTIRYGLIRNYLVVVPDLSLLRGRTEWNVYIGAALLWLFHYLFINVNHISLHPFYRDRLSRTFLIRGGDAGIESADLLRLSELGGEGSTAPYHLVNTALNLQGSGDPQLRQRKTVPFVLSKRFCGSDYTGYCETKQIEQIDRNMDLGTAMAISAAAAGPMMGARTIRSLAFFLAMLNIRLAYWLPNPERVDQSSWLDWFIHRNPGLLSLLSEACGAVSNRGRFVNCSDGGHIENLGVYELLRRRSRTIICVDSAADPKFDFSDLTTLQRYAYIGLDAEIDIDLTQLLPDEKGVSKEHVAVGKITYHNGQQGTFLYLKLSYTGDEPEYLRFYKREVSAFPHEPTSDQFFDETKFEVYRALGYHVAQNALANSTIRDCLRSCGIKDIPEENGSRDSSK